MGRNRKITNIGDIFKTRTGDLRVINYISAKEILVEFIDGKSSPFWAHIGNLRKGKYKNKYYPDVCGVGYVGEGASSSDNKQAYKNWQYLLSRVCSPVQHLRRASSKELTIQPSWLCFQEYLKKILVVLYQES